MISLIAISVIWIGFVLVVLSLLAMLIGYALELSAAAVQFLINIFSAIFIGVSIPSVALDRGADKLRRADAEPAPWFKRLVRYLLLAQAVVMPMRLMMPVQLSLESNLPRKTFSLVFGVVIISAGMIGVIQPKLVRTFAPFGSYAFMPDTDIDSGTRSASYENLRGPGDRLLRVPMIPGDLVADSRHACLTSLWTVALDGQPIEVKDFVAAERRDLGMRGLQGYLAMDALEPGKHELVVTWNSTAPKSKRDTAHDYRIPFWFAPPYQLDLAPVAGANKSSEQ